MSKQLPVYDLSQWIKSDRNIGYIVARMSAANVWELREDYKSRKDVERFMGRGDGYVIQWVELLDADGWSNGGTDLPLVPHSVVPYRLSWLRAETIAEKRYQPCENPVKAPAVTEKPQTELEPPVHWACPPGMALEATFDGEEVTEFERNREGVVTFGAPSQPVLPLDIEAATEATMRAAVVLGNQAADWLRAKGLTL